jgi:hypothetical protein
MSIDVANLVVGVAGLIVGILGIYFTVLSSPVALKALGSVLSHTELPAEFKGLSGAITLFTLIFVMLLSYLFLCFGLVAVLALVFKVYQFEYANGIAAGVVIWLSIFSLVITIGLTSSEEDAGFLAFLLLGFIGVIITFVLAAVVDKGDKKQSQQHTSTYYAQSAKPSFDS